MSKEPTSTPLPIGSSETKSDDITTILDKRKKETEFELVKYKGGHKSVKKSQVKKEIKRGLVTKPIKGPSAPVQNLVEEKVLTREERIV